jgi:hypothetical protein
VHFVADVQGVSSQQAEEVGECVGVAVGYRGRENGRGPDEALAIEAGEQVVRAGEEECVSEGEVVWGVARVGEDVARDLELAVADGDEDALLVELGYELGDWTALAIELASTCVVGLVREKMGGDERTTVKLSVGKEPHKVLSVSRRDVVPLEM